MKLLASSSSKAGLEKMIKQYFFSNNYYSLNDDGSIKTPSGVDLQGYCWQLKKNRYRFLLNESEL